MKTKRTATEKQREVLARGRARRAENLKNRELKKEVVPMAETTPQTTQAQAAIPEPVLPETNPIPVKRGSTFNGKKIGMIILAIVLIGGGLLLGKMWMSNTSQMFFGMAAALLVAIGALVLYMALAKFDISVRKTSLHAQGPETILCLNIYAKRDPGNKDHLLPDKVVIEEKQAPPGMKRKVRNFGKYVSVNTYIDGFKDCILPDYQYCDPKRMLIPVLMKHSQEYYTPVPSWFQKIKPLLFVVIIIIGALALVMIGNDTPQTPAAAPVIKHAGRIIWSILTATAI